VDACQTIENSIDHTHCVRHFFLAPIVIPIPHVPIVIATNMPYGLKPVNVTCPYCHIQCKTVVEQIMGYWLIWIIILCCGCNPCFCVPLLCCIILQKREHYCPNCKICLAIVHPWKSDKICGKIDATIDPLPFTIPEVPVQPEA